MKQKWWIWLSLMIILLLMYVVASNYPYSSNAKPLVALTDTNSVRKDLLVITGHTAARNHMHSEVLDSIADYIFVQFKASTPRVWYQVYEVNGKTYRNIVASFGPAQADRIIIGAHYDVCGKQEGADDNASGTAGLLALSRLIKEAGLKNRIDLVGYTLEEPPYFATKQMGSYVHAKSLKDSSIPVRGMVNLEMIGYYADSAGTQAYPLGFLEWVYGDTGNYITIVKNVSGGNFARDFKKEYLEHNSLPAKVFAAPSFVGGIDLSDHRNYWDMGYSAVMLTNTAFYRNREYHLSGDTLERLDVGRIGKVVDGVYRTIMALQK